MAETTSASWGDTLMGWGGQVVGGWVSQEFAPDPAATYVQKPDGGGLVNANTQTPVGGGINTNMVMMIAASVAVAVIVAVILRR